MRKTEGVSGGLEDRNEIRADSRREAHWTMWMGLIGPSVVCLYGSGLIVFEKWGALETLSNESQESLKTHANMWFCMCTVEKTSLDQCIHAVHQKPKKMGSINTVFQMKQADPYEKVYSTLLLFSLN